MISESYLVNQTSLQTAVDSDMWQALRDFIADGIQTGKWTPDSSGEYHTAKVVSDAIAHVIRNHDKYRVKPIGIDDLNAESCFRALQKAAMKRKRWSTFDERALKTMVQLLRFLGRPVDKHQIYVKMITRLAVVLSRGHIKANAEVYREKLLAYVQSSEVSPRSWPTIEMRDKAIIALLLHFPVRLNTISLLLESQTHEMMLSIPKSSMKNRVSVSVEIPDVVRVAFQRYFSMVKPSSIWLFPDRKGERLRKNGLYKAIRKRVSKTLGIKLSPHDFRRCLATICSKSFGADVSANFLVITTQILRQSYDLSDHGDRANDAIQRLVEVTK